MNENSARDCEVQIFYIARCHWHRGKCFMSDKENIDNAFLSWHNLPFHRHQCAWYRESSPVSDDCIMLGFQKELDRAWHYLHWHSIVYQTKKCSPHVCPRFLFRFSTLCLFFVDWRNFSVSIYVRRFIYLALSARVTVVIITTHRWFWLSLTRAFKSKMFC